jgi:hypothetical protein
VAKKIKTFDRTIEDLKVRRARQAVEGPQAMQDYLQAGDAALKRMAELRAERLKRESESGTESATRTPTGTSGAGRSGLYGGAEK